MSAQFTEKITLTATGRVQIYDHELGTVATDADLIRDEYNAIHPRNLARVTCRALAHEHNYYIYRMAFGNGGTTIDAAYNVVYKTPNDGQLPDLATWDSRLYHETYSEIVDAGQVTLNPLLGTDPGSADSNTGSRPGGGAVPASDPVSIPHVSGPGVRSFENGLTSEVVVTCVLNGDEPRSQNLTGQTGNDTAFTFDEIGLYSPGAPAIDTKGYQYIDVGNRATSTTPTGLQLSTTYRFDISVDGGPVQIITFTTPATGGSGPSGQILYGDLCEAMNTGAVAWGLVGEAVPGARFLITDNTGGTFPTINGVQTYGYLKVESTASGTGATIDLTGPNTNALLVQLNQPYGATLLPAVSGTLAGVENAPTNPTTERERLLTHLIFSPVEKTAQRSLTIRYTITIGYERTPSNAQ